MSTSSTWMTAAFWHSTWNPTEPESGQRPDAAMPRRGAVRSAILYVTVMEKETDRYRSSLSSGHSTVTSFQEPSPR